MTSVYHPEVSSQILDFGPSATPNAPAYFLLLEALSFDWLFTLLIFLTASLTTCHSLLLTSFLSHDFARLDHF